MKYSFRCTLLMVWLQGMMATTACAQQWSVKTNLLQNLTGTASLGVEYSFSPHYSIDVSAAYKAWDFSKKRTWRMLAVQPELRYWFCERQNGHFIGVHGHWAKFNMGNMKMPWGLWNNLELYRFQGDLWGAGFCYGYDWLLSKHWNLEAVVGVGYARVFYDQYPCADCGRKMDSDKKNYWGPTKLALSLVYLF